MDDPGKSLAPPEARPAPGRTALGWAAVALLLVLQYGLFYQFAQREVVWAFPAAHDQIGYLSESYETYEEILDKGVWAGLRHGYAMRNPQGVLFHLEAALLFLALGPTRLSALTLTFLHFALLQLVLVAVLRWLTRRWSVALLGLGLLLTALSPFFWAGGLMDFRLDFGAVCLFGVLLCLAVRSNVFASRRWSAAVGAAAAVLVLFRVITAVYLAGIGAALVPFLAVRLARKWRDPAARRVELRRWAGLAVASAILCAVAVPVLWDLRTRLQQYYVLGHVTGEETKVRLRMFFEGGNRDYYSFYVKSLLTDHAGPVFLRLGTLALAVCGVLALGRRAAARRPGAAFVAGAAAALFVPLAVYAVAAARPLPGRWLARLDPFAALPWAASVAAAAALAGALRRARAPAGDGRIHAGPAFVLMALALVVPLAVLTAGTHRTPVVANVALPALLWVVLVAVVGLTGAHRGGRSPADGWLAALAAVALLCGACTLFDQYGRRTRATRERADMERLIEMYDLIDHYCAEAGWAEPVIASTGIFDFLNWGVARVYMYERHGAYRKTGAALECLFRRTAADVDHDIAASHFVLLIHLRRTTCPFEDSMLELAPQVRAACEKYLRRVRTFQFFGEEVDLYVRPCVKSEGFSGPWVTADGMTLKGPGWALGGCKRVELRGKTPFGLLRKEPAPSATLALPGQAPRELKAALTHQGDDYCITLELPRAPLPEDAPVEVRLTFDTYFEPKDHGWQGDPRRLVILKPESTVLVH